MNTHTTASRLQPETSAALRHPTLAPAWLIICLGMLLMSACDRPAQQTSVPTPYPSATEDATVTPAEIIPQAVEIRFENGALLKGYGFHPRRQRAGQPVQLAFYWQNLPEFEPVTLATFVHLQGDTFRFQADHHLIRGQTSYYPTVTIPIDAPPGLYRLRIGLYDITDGQRVRASTRLPRRRQAVILPHQLDVLPIDN